MISFSAFCDELCKIAGAPPPLPGAVKALGSGAAAAAKTVMKPKLYGQEGFNAFMQGTQAAKTNPFKGLVPN